jgi:hypothetical protein
MSMEGAYLLAMRCPVYRRRESHSGIRMELENLIGDGKGKRPSGEHREAEIPKLRSGTDHLVVVLKRL